MKRHICLIYLLLVLCVMAGCASKEAGGPAALTEPETQTEQKEQSIAAADLVAAFEQNYEGCGESGLDTDDQIGTELTALRSIQSNSTTAWPEDFEQQYRDWRAGMLTEKKDDLREAYKEVVVGEKIYANPYDSGLVFADYVDFDNDGWEELFMISVQERGSTFLLSAYRAENETVTKCGEVTEWVARNASNVRYCSSNNRTCVAVESVEAGEFFPVRNTYYGMKDKTFELLDDIELSHGNPYVRLDFEDHYYDSTKGNSPESEITEDQYNTVLGKYNIEETDLFIDSMWNQDDLFYPANRGIISQLSDDMPRKLALLDKLNEETEKGGVKYARLIDFDRDGVEELLLLQSAPDQYSTIRCIFNLYKWDGSTVKKDELTHAPSKEYPSNKDYQHLCIFPESWPDDISLDVCRNKETGEIGVLYEGELAIDGELQSGAAIICSCFVSNNDSVAYYAMNSVFDWWAETDEDLQKANARIGEEMKIYVAYKSQYEIIETAGERAYKIGSPYIIEKKDTIEQTRRQLVQITTAEDADKLQYFIEHCDTETFARDYIKGFNKEMCMYARNAVYAKAGRKFSADNIREYFEKYDWYKPTIEPGDFQESMLNEHQTANKNLVVAFEAEMGWR